VAEAAGDGETCCDHCKDSLGSFCKVINHWVSMVLTGSDEHLETKVVRSRLNSFAANPVVHTQR